MVPLILDSEISVSNHDTYVQKKINTPLHETTLYEHRKRVSFDDMDTIHEVISLSEFTRKEKKATWCNLKDMARMKELAKSDAKIVDFGILIQGTCVSNRGLEGKTREGALRKGNLRVNAYAAVFAEIEFQQREGFIDDEVLADTYYICSWHSAKEAHRLGLVDEAEAMSIHNSELNDSASFLQFQPR